MVIVRLARRVPARDRAGLLLSRALLHRRCCPRSRCCVGVAAGSAERAIAAFAPLTAAADRDRARGPRARLRLRDRGARLPVPLDATAGEPHALRAESVRRVAGDRALHPRAHQQPTSGSRCSDPSRRSTSSRGRRSATGYIYMYPLLERQALARRDAGRDDRAGRGGASGVRGLRLDPAPRGSRARRGPARPRLVAALHGRRVTTWSASPTSTRRARPRIVWGDAARSVPPEVGEPRLHLPAQERRAVQRAVTAAAPLELRSERLRLRRFRPDDLAPFAALNADPRGDAAPARARSRAPRATRSPRASTRTSTRTASGCSRSRSSTESRFAGFVGLSVPRFAAPFTPCVEIGWRLAARHQGRGYATEGARAALAFGFEQLGLDEIVSFTVPANTRSRRVMEKLGHRRAIRPTTSTIRCCRRDIRCAGTSCTDSARALGGAEWARLTRSCSTASARPRSRASGRACSTATACATTTTPRSRGSRRSASRPRPTRPCSSTVPGRACASSRSRRPSATRGRIHLDVAVSDRAREVARLRALGASRACARRATTR